VSSVWGVGKREVEGVGRRVEGETEGMYRREKIFYGKVEKRLTLLERWGGRDMG